ncbi:MAG: alanine--tRNA ligase [Candidatus Omnitrophota bacterium]
MKTDIIRDSFLSFFKGKNHTICESDQLVPKNDPTVLFTSAGMNQFKEQFIGKISGFTRAATCQKCLRTADLENVGRTSGHHTFFEMLGNFSFGDYFKKEAIAWGWEYLTEVLKLPPEKLWVSVYKSDDEVFDIWHKVIKIPEGKIVRLGDHENFWPADAPQLGPNGPCGPCSEIFYDWGVSAGCKKQNCSPACECGRFLEIWNLVFTQYDRKDRGKLVPLPNKNIDTGMGLERIARVMQQKNTNFEIDIFLPVIAEILKNVSGEHRDNIKGALFAIVDHARAVTFAIGDGVIPSNEERGYVIRKLIRRAVWHGKNVNINKPFLYKLVPIITSVMHHPYPELTKRRENISQIILAEEERFQNTLRDGEQILQNILEHLKSKGENILPGQEIFRLYDTYGFPPELTARAISEQGFIADMDGFKQALDEQSRRSKKQSKISGEIFTKGMPEELSKLAADVVFAGYETLATKAEVLMLLKGPNITDILSEGEEGSMVLDKTPFYAEAGGQDGDIGRISNENFVAEVQDTRKADGVILQNVVVKKGKVTRGDMAEALVDQKRRKYIERNHTATHLLHNALRTVLGEHVEQAGSLVSAERLRFDFTHFKALTSEQVNRTENIVNENILGNTKVNTCEMDVDQAKKTGALALFGEKYGQKVRVVSIGDYSKEFCGGTHTVFTGEVGLFKIISESSIASGIRRIEALTGTSAYQRIKEDEILLLKMTQKLNVPLDRLAEQLDKVLNKSKELQKEIDDLKIKDFSDQIEELLKGMKVIDGVNVLVREIASIEMNILRKLQDMLRARIKSGIIVLAANYNNRPQFVCTVSEDYVKKGFHAGEIVRELAKITDGGGGGKPQIAQAGGKNPQKLNQALDSLESIIISLAANRK